MFWPSDAIWPCNYRMRRNLGWACWEPVQKTKKFLAAILLIPRSMLCGCILTRWNTVFIPLKTESGIHSRTNVFDVVLRRRRPQGRVAIQLDDECHTCSTSRLHRLAAKKILPSDLRISGVAEVGEEDSKFLQHRGVLKVKISQIGRAHV